MCANVASVSATATTKEVPAIVPLTMPHVEPRTERCVTVREYVSVEDAHAVETPSTEDPPVKTAL